MDVIKRFFITIMLTVCALALNVGVSLMAAFPIARNLFKGANKMLVFILMSMFFPGSLVATITILKDILHLGLVKSIILLG